MCYFITLIAPSDDAAGLRAVMERHGRAASPIDNKSMRLVLDDHERQYLTTNGDCDCGTVLTLQQESDSFEQELVKDAARMRRKRWSEAKISRAIDERRKAHTHRDGGGPDTLELWNAVLHDLGEELRLPYVGIFVRFYSGSVVSETFRASRRTVPRRASWDDALASLQHDEVTIFRLT
ncbi:MAG TPA: hypothetical protein VK669_12000 [Candidatus Limnocylindrales bacterium]|nr:hypothetical protein [Candidatus Limnocylindrales bacterium]